MSESPNPIRVGNTGFLCITENRFLVEIRGVEYNQIWVSFPGTNYPIVGMGGRLEFHGAAGFSAYNVQILRYAERARDGIILERSESAEQRTHRTSWRIPTDINIFFRTPNSEELFNGVMEDLSAEGCQLRADPVLSVRTPLHLTFALDRQHGNQTVEARVCYVQDESSLRSPVGLRYGCRFTQIPPETKRLLTLFLYHHVRRLYPKDVAAMYPRVRRPKSETNAG